MKRTTKLPLRLRDPDLKESVELFTRYLLELHDETDPSQGNATEEGKLERARLAVHHWWKLYGYLMLWAQAHLTGYHIAKRNPKVVDLLAKFRGSTIDDDAHELELLGLLFVMNPPAGADDATEALSKHIRKAGAGIDIETIRRVIDELHWSTDANSSFWRFPLGRALRALNYGEMDPFFAPSKKKVRGKAYTLASYRALAISHVYFRQGKGFKKHAALEAVAQEIAVSTETIRDWEKTLKHEDYFWYEWHAARLAGKIEGLGNSLSRQEIQRRYFEWQFGFRTNIDMAYTFLSWSKDQWSLDTIKKQLKQGHQRA